MQQNRVPGATPMMGGAFNPMMGGAFNPAFPGMGMPAYGGFNPMTAAGRGGFMAGFDNMMGMTGGGRGGMRPGGGQNQYMNRMGRGGSMGAGGGGGKLLKCSWLCKLTNFALMHMFYQACISILHSLTNSKVTAMLVAAAAAVAVDRKYICRNFVATTLLCSNDNKKANMHIFLRERSMALQKRQKVLYLY